MAKVPLAPEAGPANAPEKRTPVAVIASITALLGAVTGLIVALGPLGKMIYPGPGPNPTAILTIYPQSLHFDSGVQDCMSKTHRAFKGATNVLEEGTWAVQANSHGTQVIILCGWSPGNTNAMVIAAGTDPNKAKAAAVDYKQEVFGQ